MIFSSSFELVQVITPPSCAEGLLVKCVAACCETGKVSIHIFLFWLFAQNSFQILFRHKHLDLGY